MRDVDAGGLGGAVEIAGLRELERAADRCDRAGILEREVVDVIGDHQEARRAAPAGMVEPQKEHPRRICDRPLLGERPVLALGVAVNVGDGGDPRIGHQIKTARLEMSRGWTENRTRIATFVKVGF